MSDFFTILAKADQLVSQGLKLLRSEILHGFEGLLKVCLRVTQGSLQVCVVLLALVETALQVTQARIFLVQQVPQLGEIGG